MSNLRAVLVALAIVAMVIAPVLASFVGVGSSSGLSAFAAVLAGPAMQDDDDDGNDDNDGNGDGDDGNNDGADGDDEGNVVNDDDDNDGGGNDDDDTNDDDNDDGSNDDDSGDNDNDGGGDDGDDDDGGAASPFVNSVSPAASRAQSSDCSAPGQEMFVTSSDGTVSVRIFASMPQGVRLVVRKPVDAGSVPAVPGQQVDALLFELTAQTCDGQSLARLPGEANLGVRYSDGDVGGLNEANFKIARLDQGTWRAVEKQAADPNANFVSATIMDLGTYVVHVP